MSTRGSDYGPGSPLAALDLQEPYLRQILGFVGIGDVPFVSANGQGPNDPNSAEVLAQARADLLALVSTPAGVVG